MSNRERQILCDITYTWNRKKQNVYSKQKQTQDTENKLVVTRGKNKKKGKTGAWA